MVSNWAEKPALSERQAQILRALCREYIVSGRPVASSALSRALGLRWSSATIRNELVALEHGGLVYQPHHAAGRLPTASGLERYIRDLPLPTAPPPTIRRAVDSSLAQRVSGAGDMRATARVLSELVGCVAVAFIGEPRQAVMRRIELFVMSGSCALITLTLDDGTASRHPIRLDSRLLERADDTALDHLRGRLRELCLGKTLGEARYFLQSQLHEEEGRLDRLVRESLRLGLLMCTMAHLDPLWLQVAGQRMLAQGAGAGGLDTLAHILGVLEDYHQLAELLCQLLPPAGDDLRAEVRIGEGLHALLPADRAEVPAMSLVGCRLPQEGGGRTGAVALLGPDRMDYEAVIPLVEYAAQALASRTCA